jgi:hypothetical protein
MTSEQAGLGSPDLTTLVLEAWSLELTGDQVIYYVVRESGCMWNEAKLAVENVYNDMKD